MAALLHGTTIVLPGASFKPEESIKAVQQQRCVLHYIMQHSSDICLLNQ